MAGVEQRGGQPHPEQPRQPEQHKPQQEGGNGAPGIPLTLNQRSKPPPEGSAQGGHDSTNVQQGSPAEGPLSRMWEKLGDRRAIIRCKFPKTIFSPSDIPRMFEHEIPTDEAIEQGQPWVENLKSLDRQELEQKLESLERFKREEFPRLGEKWQSQQQSELLEYEMEAIREQLRQRLG